MPLQTFPYDSAEYLDTAEGLAFYISETVASGDPEEFAQALPIVERARSMHQIIGRNGELPTALNAVAPGDELPALLAILSDLGFRLTIEPLEADQAEAA